MALLGLLLLPANYRAGAEIAHAHSFIQLWADAADGTIRHHHDHGLAHPGAERSPSWFDSSGGETGTTASASIDDERADAAGQQESTPVSSGVHLLLTVMATIVAPGIRQAPIAVSGRRQSGLSPRIFAPPPRWTTAAS